MNNVSEPVMEVRHADLERESKNSEYKSKCPKCEGGVLLVRRDPTTFRLLEYDNCIKCGQPVLYLDIVDLRRMDGE